VKLYDWDVNCFVTEDNRRREETVRVQSIDERAAKVAAVWKLEAWPSRCYVIAKAARKVGFVKEVEAAR